MEERHSPEWTRNRRSQETTEREPVRLFPDEPQQLNRATPEIQRIIRGHLEEKARRESRRKWSGRGLMALGATTMLSSCPLYMFSLMGFQTVALEAILVSLGMIVGGFALTAIRPRLRDTNEALLVAMKYGNRLTSARLALELDVSFDKAEKIIRELVKSGVAEIDLDYKDPDHSIAYRIKGL